MGAGCYFVNCYQVKSSVKTELYQKLTNNQLALVQWDLNPHNTRYERAVLPIKL